MILNWRKKPLDVNEMIAVVIDSMTLKLQKHNATSSVTA